MSGMPDQLGIPYAMQVARIVSTLRRAENCDRNVVSSTRVRHGVERLAQVADKMNQELERLTPGRKGLRRIAQDLGKLIDLRHHAVIVRAVFRLVPA